MFALSSVPWAEVLLVVVAASLIWVPVPSIRGYSRRRPEWVHAERMKALEMGHPMPSSLWPRACVCVAIGAGVPGAAFFSALIATLEGALHGDAVIVAWGVAFLVSTVAVGCATSLAFALLGSRQRAQEPRTGAKPPAFDPDSFEVADHRR